MKVREQAGIPNDRLVLESLEAGTSPMSTRPPPRGWLRTSEVRQGRVALALTNAHNGVFTVMMLLGRADQTQRAASQCLE